MTIEHGITANGEHYVEAETGTVNIGDTSLTNSALKQSR